MDWAISGECGSRDEKSFVLITVGDSGRILWRLAEDLLMLFFAWIVVRFIRHLLTFTPSTTMNGFYRQKLMDYKMIFTAVLRVD